MINREPQPVFEPRTFLLMLAAFIGNATVLGFDIVLTFILPTALLFQLKQRWRIPRQSLLSLFVIIVLLIFSAVRSPWIGIPYTDGYYLWAWKALFLTLLVAFNPRVNWPVGNTTALAGIVFALLAMGHMEGGRLYSAFGPNMLYRIFGLLLVFSVMEWFEARLTRRLVMSAFITVAAISILLTGSVGGFAMLAIAGAAIVYLYSKRVFLLLTVLVGMALSLAWTNSITFVLGESSPETLTRLAYKYTNLAASSRYVNWSEIASSSVSLFGHSYNDFSLTWSLVHQYPHNIFLELYGFYGIGGIGLSIVIVSGVFVALGRWHAHDSIAIMLIVLLIGTLLSGDLTDNYGVVGLAAGLVIRNPRRRLNKRGLRTSRTSRGFIPASTAKRVDRFRV